MSGFINGIFRFITIVSPKRGSFLPCVTWMSGAGRKYVRLSPIIDERPHSTATFILICHANYLDLEMTARSDNKNYQSSKNKLRKKTLAQDKGVNNACTDRQGCRSRRKEFHKFTTVKYSLVLSQLIQRSYLKLWQRFFFWDCLRLSSKLQLIINHLLKWDKFYLPSLYLLVYFSSIEIDAGHLHVRDIFD